MIVAQNSAMIPAEVVSGELYETGNSHQVAAVLNTTFQLGRHYACLHRDAEVTVGTRTISLAVNGELRERLREEAVCNLAKVCLGDDKTPRLDAVVSAEEELLVKAKKKAVKIRASIAESLKGVRSLSKRAAIVRHGGKRFERLFTELCRAASTRDFSRLGEFSIVPSVIGDNPLPLVREHLMGAEEDFTSDAHQLVECGRGPARSFSSDGAYDPFRDLD